MTPGQLSVQKFLVANAKAQLESFYAEYVKESKANGQPPDSLASKINDAIEEAAAIQVTLDGIRNSNT